jgi:O-antigen ligase
VAANDAGQLGNSTISWLRFAQTASLALFAAEFVRSRRDVRVLLAGFAAGALYAVGAAVVDLSEGGPLDARYGGLHNENITGLLAGLLVAVGAFPALTKRVLPRVLLVLAGVIGLLLAKSVAAFIATAVAVALGVAFWRRSAPIQRIAAAVAAVAVTAFVIVSLVQLLRPEATPASENYQDSSTSQRVILATAGLEVFERNPVFGVGWRRSETPEVIGAGDIAFELRRRFPEARYRIFPDTTPTSVHNTFVQILADLGAVGFVLFAAMIFGLVRGIRRALRAIEPEDPLRAAAWTLAVLVGIVLIWLNDNPLYGWQVETIMLALAAGSLAGLARARGRTDG